MVARSSFVAVNAFEDIPVKALYTTRLEGKVKVTIHPSI